MKRCGKCGKKKPFSDFNRFIRAKDGLQPYCRVCARAYYQARNTEIRALIQARKRQLRTELLLFVRAYLLEHPCTDCGERDPVVLEFDHVRGVKAGNVSTMMREPVTLKRLQEEIAKCDVRCANCHRRRTARTLGWYAGLDLKLAPVA